MQLPAELIEKGIVYDIEVLPNFFSVTAYSLKHERYEEFVIYEEGNRDDRAKLLRIFRDRFIIGYNNSNFDDGLIEYLFRNPEATNVDLFEQAQIYIQERNPFKYSTCSFARSYDLLELIRAGFNTISLKGVAVNLKFPKIQDMPIHYLDHIKAEQVSDILSYNRNDVEITLQLLREIAGKIEMRDNLSKLFKTKLHSASDSAIAKILLNKWYQEQSGMSDSEFKEFRYSKTEREDLRMADLIHDYVQFQTPELREFLYNLRNKVIVKASTSPTRDQYYCDIPTLEFRGIRYSIGLGGIHTEDKHLVWNAKGDEILLDADVASQYPTAILHNELCPEHLDKDTFLPLFRDIVDKRLYHKSKKKEDPSHEVIQQGLKITINTVYGLLNSKTFWLFDPKVTFQVTINNQLLIMMLVESLELSGYHVISANTDGVLIRCQKDDLTAIRKIFKKWEDKSGFALEETQYDLYIRRDVNNYLSRTAYGDVKAKGCFVPQNGLINGYKFPIVGKALQAKYLRGENPLEFIRNHTDIYDFCASQKVGKQFTNVLETVDRSTRYKGNSGELTRPIHEYKQTASEDVQATVRYFISEPDRTNNVFTGKRLRKRKVVDGEPSYIDYCAGWFATLFNDYYQGEYNLDFLFYENLINKELSKIEGFAFKEKYPESLEPTIQLTLDLGVLV